ncbi:hypothetical protein SERLA73DRAFT_163213 [Serpula lacrymans var. lacrymans S7.3]|uniref:Integral membrane protein n=2 Tax=Serpula lacrymans var. lacrymans TaxID=341189 RepID=F8QC89_SERL3|nr:uncharacterized protein SERLADRAFT_418414 [Serpula lacrymans var. lacrymans S7.9]EGN94208.1 hypothetical protein SERLA73DRAFT_163213 [Serpula lacrymans var. lacrymans S7.3]EGO19632.1 hypothetical protein SERLADRAFT_418414 [Serpula lacrymans var. lacrymans S7.9]
MADLAELIMRGPQLGTMFAMVLYGITCMQTFLYYRNYPEDRWGVKLTVAVVWILESAHSGMAVASMDYYLIVNFSDSDVILSISHLMSVTYIIGFLNIFVVNLYYAWRIWTLSMKLYIPILLVILAMIRYSLTLAVCAYSIIYRQSWLTFREHAGSYVYGCFAMGIVSDTASAAILAYFLHMQCPTSSLKRTRRLIDQLLFYAIGAGVAAVLFDILEMIVAWLDGNSSKAASTDPFGNSSYETNMSNSLNVRHHQVKTVTQGPLVDHFSSVLAVDPILSSEQSSGPNFALKATELRI